MRGANDKYAIEIAMIREPKTLTEAINFTKVAQSNHALLSSRPRGILRQVTFEDEHKEQDFQDDKYKGEEGDFKSTLNAMMALLQKMNVKMDSAVQSSKVSSPTSDSATCYSTPPSSPTRASDRSDINQNTTQSSSLSRVWCFNCDQIGHFAKNRPLRKSQHERNKEPLNS